MKQTDRDIIRLFLRESKTYRWRRDAMLLFAAVTYAVGTFIGPFVIAQLLTIIQHNQILTAPNLWQLVWIYALSQIWSEVLGWRIVLYFCWTFESALQRDIYNRCFDKLIHQTIFFHTNKFGGSLVSQTSKLSGAVERFWDTITWSIMPLIISLFGSIIVLWSILWQYALLLLLLSIVFAIAVYVGSKPMAKLSEKEASTSNAVSGRLADVVSNILAVKSSSMEHEEQTQFLKTTNTWRGAMLGTMRGFLKVSTVYSSINTIINIAAIIFAIYAAQHNIVSIATIYLIITYTASVTRELWNMNGIMRSYNRIIGDSHDMMAILNAPTTLTDSTNVPIEVSKGFIDISDITYTHDEGQGDTLFHNFSLKINPGEKIGLVGASGSGKSTLTKLLLRFSDIDSGKITIDNQNIANVSQESLRANIAYVPQEPLLFHRSIRENISYGKPGATEKEIINAAKKAGAYAFISKLKDGFDTEVGERGVKLSGGQRQRIAIARAILKDAPILILDEATSALDSESEAYIQKSLESLMKNRTSIVVAHRLSTISKLDRIVVMKDGKIIEDGTHAQLIAKKRGTYAALWKRQSGGFIEED